MRPAAERTGPDDRPPADDGRPSSEPLRPAISSALEAGSGTLRERLRLIRAHSPPHGRYTLLGELAEGGMGRILRVWDEVLQRELAMKVIATPSEDEADAEARLVEDRRVARFIEEARVTGQLDHPGIVPVHEIAQDGEGLLYFTMPLVRGRTLGELFELVCAGREGWTLHRALDLLHKVCLTVAFAHSRGVIHRDLKPSNVMVGPFGEVYVLDWGLALIEGRGGGARIVGTPAYMAPEQAAHPADVDARADVYALGSILYELLCGSVPHQKTIEAEGETTSIDRLLQSAPRPPEELAHDVPAELLAICHKAMARAPEERYASAQELAEDLRSWLEGRVVGAYEATPLERLRKWRARNRGLAHALDALVLVALVSAALLLVMREGKLREVHARNLTIREQLYSLNMVAADLHQRADELSSARARLEACPPEHRGWEWDHLMLVSGASRRTLAHPDAEGLVSLAVDAEGELLATGSNNGLIRLWDVATGAPRGALQGHAGAVEVLAFRPGGRLLASASSDNTVRLWDVTEGRVLRILEEHERSVTTLAFSPDGGLLASGDRAGELVVRVPLSGQAPLRLRTPDVPVTALAFEPSGAHLVAGTATGHLQRWRLADRALVADVLHESGPVNALVFGPDGERLVVACGDRISVVHRRHLAHLRTISDASGWTTCLALSSDGERLLAGDPDGRVSLWDLASGAEPARFYDHIEEVNALAFLPRGRGFASVSEDGTARLWSEASQGVRVLADDMLRLRTIAFRPDGRRLATSSFDGRIRIWDAASGDLLETLPTLTSGDVLAWTAEDALVFGLDDADLRIRRSGAPAWELLSGSGGRPIAIATVPGTGAVLARFSEGMLHLWESGEVRPRLSLELGRDYSFTLAVHPSGATFATGSEDGTVAIRSTADGALLRELRADQHEILSLAYSPAGDLLAAGTANRTVLLWDPADGSLRRRLEGHTGRVGALAFAADGSRLFSGSRDQTVRVWNPTTGEPLLTLHGHDGDVRALAYEPRSRQLASGSEDGTVRLWRAGREADLGPP